MEMIRRYKNMLNLVDGWLNTLNTSEHGVLLGVLVALSYFLNYYGTMILLLVKTAGMAVVAVAIYIGYRLLVRMEPKDDFE